MAQPHTGPEVHQDGTGQDFGTRYSQDGYCTHGCQPHAYIYIICRWQPYRQRALGRKRGGKAQVHAHTLRHAVGNAQGI